MTLFAQEYQKKRIASQRFSLQEFNMFYDTLTVVFRRCMTKISLMYFLPEKWVIQVPLQYEYLHNI